jgi:hypothetical protein
MRQTRNEEYTEVRHRIIEQMVCEVDGTTEDTEPTKRPEGWVTIFQQIDGRNHTMDFCDWACLYGFVQDFGEEGPNSLLALLQRSVDAVKAEKEAVK